MTKTEERHPASTKRVLFKTRFIWDPETGDATSGWHEGFYVKDANKYVRNVNRWKDTNTHEWYEDEDVIAWQDINKSDEPIPWKEEI